MPLCRTVTLQGNISETIKFPIGMVEDITDGEWHVALSSVSLHYGSQLIEKCLVSVSTNLVTQKSVNSRGEVVKEEASLGITTFGGNTANQLVTLGFRNRDFLYVNQAQSVLGVNIRNIETQNNLAGAKAVILLCLKRVK